MKTKEIYLTLILIFLSGHTTLAAPHAATLILQKGKVYKTQKGTKPTPVKTGERLPLGSEIKTGKNSSAKLVLTDQTQINLGPDSTFKIELVKKDKPSVINLKKGTARVNVVKDLLASRKQDYKRKTKVFLRTKTATMGVRGTDFQAVYNGENNITSCVTFEGEVALAPIEESEKINLSTLEDKVSGDKSVTITEGQFSSANPKQEAPTIPTKLSPAQFESLKSNTDLSKKDSAASTSATADAPKFISPIPPGMDAKAFMGSSGKMEKQLAKELGIKTEELRAAMYAGQPVGPGGLMYGGPAGLGGPPGMPGDPGTPPPGGMEGMPGMAPPPEGFYNKDTGQFAPAAGGFVDFSTGLYIPPPPGSTYDSNTGVFIPPPTFGGFDPNSGGYVPPAGYDLDPNRGFVPVNEPRPGDYGRGPGDPNRPTEMNPDGTPKNPGDYPTGAPGAPPPGGYSGASPPGGYYDPAMGGYPPPGGYYDPAMGGYPPPGGYYDPAMGGYPPPGGYYDPAMGGYPPPGGYYDPAMGGYPPPPGEYYDPATGEYYDPTYDPYSDPWYEPYDPACPECVDPCYPWDQHPECWPENNDGTLPDGTSDTNTDVNFSITVE